MKYKSTELMLFEDSLFEPCLEAFYLLSHIQ